MLHLHRSRSQSDPEVPVARAEEEATVTEALAPTFEEPDLDESSDCVSADDGDVAPVSDIPLSRTGEADVGVGPEDSVLSPHSSKKDAKSSGGHKDEHQSFVRCLSFCHPFSLHVNRPDGQASAVYPPPAPAGNGMQSLRKLYRIGCGPSSSHTMGPAKAACQFGARYPKAEYFEVTLYGSLAATGAGHMTDVAIETALAPRKVFFVWKPEVVLPRHPNALQFKAFGRNDPGKSESSPPPLDRVKNEADRQRLQRQASRKVLQPSLSLVEQPMILGSHICYSVGGGAIVDDETMTGPPGSKEAAIHEVYELYSVNRLIEWADARGALLFEYVYGCEGQGIKDHLADVWQAMNASIDRGLHAVGVLPGGIGLHKRARSYYLHAQNLAPAMQRTPLLFAYALAVSEENASMGIVVTAPTCGSCGIMPSVLRYLRETLPGVREADIIDALAIAGLFGNVVKTNASISGAEIGCQGEVGVATAMAAAAACHLMGGTTAQIENAAEIGIEHYLGLTCDPVNGLVQVPCIERNALSATRAIDCATFALLGDGRHKVSFDESILTLKLTGIDMNAAYRETARGGLATSFDLDERLDAMLKLKLQEVCAKQSEAF